MTNNTNLYYNISENIIFSKEGHDPPGPPLESPMFTCILSVVQTHADLIVIESQMWGFLTRNSVFKSLPSLQVTWAWNSVQIFHFPTEM